MLKICVNNSLLCNAVSDTIALRTKGEEIMPRQDLWKTNLRTARARWGITRKQIALQILRIYSIQYRFSLSAGDLLFLDKKWYVTHSGLLRLSHRRRCRGIDVMSVPNLCDPSHGPVRFQGDCLHFRRHRWLWGYGDADPSNVSSLARGAEMRVAETRAVNRALRKAYGIGICSVEEIGSFAESNPPTRGPRSCRPRRLTEMAEPSGAPRSGAVSAN